MIVIPEEETITMREKMRKPWKTRITRLTSMMLPLMRAVERISWTTWRSTLFITNSLNFRDY